MRWWNYGFSIQRMSWALLLIILGGGPAVYFYGVVELIGASLSIVNTIRTKHIDQSWRGILLPLLYSLGFLVMPTGGDGPLFGLALAAIGGFRLASLLYLGVSYSSGAATALRVVDRGPYALVRHPMQLSGLLMRFAFAIDASSLWNFVGLVVMCGSAYAVVRIEEQFLGKFSDFRQYSQTVEWRLCPGIW